MSRFVRSMVGGAMALGLSLTALAAVAPQASSAGGALATVGNGITTTDLNAIGVTPAALAQSLVGTGVTVSNVTFSGDNAQAGLVHVVDPAVVSFNDGVILSSGNVADIVGPNKSESTTGVATGAADTDLTGLIANTQTVNPMTYDATSLEFDVVPTTDHIYFTYTFGSDEYLEWVNLFNDVFAFYVNGQNCAVTPGGDAVSIDTINSTVNAGLYRDNSFVSPPANPINIESDGLTVEMICSAPVNAGVTNHMKLAIADTSDQILDSVVMIKAQSLGTTKPESCNNGVDDNDDTKVDDADPICQTTTVAPPTGSSGIGSSNTAPPFTGNEGTGIPMDASIFGWTPPADSGTIETQWTVTGINGTVGTCDITPTGRQPINADGSIASATAICPNEGEYVAKIEGWDGEGGSAFDYDVDFFVHNAPPEVTIDTVTPALPAAMAAAMAAPAPLTATTFNASAGSPVDVSATVTDPGTTDTASCSIDWGDGTSGTGSLAGSTCSASHTYAAEGAYVLAMTVTDGGGATAGAAAVVQVGPAVAGPSVDLGVSNATPVTGEGVVMTATISDPANPAPGGRVSFFDGATRLATRTVAGGVATYTNRKLALGSHSITAVWSASRTATPITSSASVVEVGEPATNVILTGGPTTALASRTITLRARVRVTLPGKGKVAPGTVTFYDDGTPIATVTLVTPVATLATTFAPGVHTITASYDGSSTLQPSAASSALVVTTS